MQCYRGLHAFSSSLHRTTTVSFQELMCMACYKPRVYLNPGSGIEVHHTGHGGQPGGSHCSATGTWAHRQHPRTAWPRYAPSRI